MPLFKSIIDDLFPNVKSEEINYSWLREAFDKRCSEMGYEPVDSMYQKLVETYKMSGYRQGIMLVGNPYTGKSFVLRTLVDAICVKNQLKDNQMDLGMS